WWLAGTPLSDVVSYGDLVQRSRDFALRNGAEVTDVSFDLFRGEVTVAVRNTDRVEGGDTRMQARATARIELTGGLCLRSGVIGYRVEGTCRTQAPPEPTPEPTTPEPTPEPGEGEPSQEPTPEPTPDPYEPPHLAAHDARTVLVD
ncbi:MAG: hypothetical protein ACTMIR_07815, partial [Cellulomonadaceae bacterium]